MILVTIRDALRTGWQSHDTRSRWLLAGVIAATLIGVVASAFTPYPPAWRILRLVVDALFLAALLVIVATPEAMQPPPQPPPPPATWATAPLRVLRGIGWLIAQVLIWTLATAIIVGLFTAPGENAAVIIWRVTTAVSAAVVVRSRLRHAFLHGSRALRILSGSIVGIEIVALIATLWIDVPAIVQSLDLANDGAIARLESRQGVLLPPGFAAVIGANPRFKAAFRTQDDRIFATPEAASLFRFLGEHSFTIALHNVLTHPEALGCAIARNPDAPTSGYASQTGVVSYVLPLYARCSPGLEKLAGFIDALPLEATPQERAADIRTCGSVRFGATYSAIASLRAQPAAQAAVIAMLPKIGFPPGTCK